MKAMSQELIRLEIRLMVVLLSLLVGQASFAVARGLDGGNQISAAALAAGEFSVTGRLGAPLGSVLVIEAVRVRAASFNPHQPDMESQRFVLRVFAVNGRKLANSVDMDYSLDPFCDPVSVPEAVLPPVASQSSVVSPQTTESDSEPYTLLVHEVGEFRGSPSGLSPVFCLPKPVTGPFGFSTSLIVDGEDAISYMRAAELVVRPVAKETPHSPEGIAKILDDQIHSWDLEPILTSKASSAGSALRAIMLKQAAALELDRNLLQTSLDNAVAGLPLKGGAWVPVRAAAIKTPAGDVWAILWHRIMRDIVRQPSGMAAIPVYEEIHWSGSVEAAASLSSGSGELLKVRHIDW